jgi:plasmid stabilization system protein ParE
LRYEVLVQPTAEAEIEEAYLYLRETASPEAADRWFTSFLDAVLTLEEMPTRCPIAPEDPFFSDELRHLLLRPYRVMFTVRPGRVHVLHIRHMARETLSDEG